MSALGTESPPVRSPDIFPAHVNTTRHMELPSELHRQLLCLLDAYARVDEHGRRVAWRPQAQLAASLGVSRRTVQRLLADLRQPGPDQIRGAPAAGLRLGLVAVLRTRYTDPATGRHRLGRNVYALLFVPGEAALTPRLYDSKASDVSAGHVNTTLALLSHRNKRPPTIPPYPPPLEQPKHASVHACSVCGEACVANLDTHLGCVGEKADAYRSDILADLERAFGPVEILEEREHEAPYLPPELPDGWVWTWRKEPFGRCARCPWRASMLGPDGKPWHAWCWAHWDVPVPDYDRKEERKHYHQHKRAEQA